MTPEPQETRWYHRLLLAIVFGCGVILLWGYIQYDLQPDAEEQAHIDGYNNALYHELMDQAAEDEGRARYHEQQAENARNAEIQDAVNEALRNRE